MQKRLRGSLVAQLVMVVTQAIVTKSPRVNYSIYTPTSYQLLKCNLILALKFGKSEATCVIGISGGQFFPISPPALFKYNAG